MPWRSAYSAIHFSSAIPPTSSGSGPMTLTACFSIRSLKFSPEVDLFSGVNRERGTLRDFAKKVGVGVRRVVAGDQVFEPCDVERFKRSRKRDRILYCPAGSAVQGEADFIAEDFLHGFDAGDDMFEAAFRHEAAIGVRCSRPRFVVPPVGHGAHHRRIVKADCLLDEGEALFGFFHLRPCSRRSLVAFGRSWGSGRLRCRRGRGRESSRRAVYIPALRPPALRCPRALSRSRSPPNPRA